MATVVLVARVVLAAVLLTAAVGKFMDLQGSRRALLSFGIPRGLGTAIVGTALPTAELVIGVALLLTPTAQWAGIAAAVMLAVFIAAMARSLSQGLAPDCHCFGALFSSKTGARAISRNAVLAALGVFVGIRGPGPSITTWLGDRSALELVATFGGLALVAAATTAIWGVTQNRRLREQLREAEETIDAIPPGLPVGAVAPRFTVPDGEDGTVSLDELCSAGRPVLLVFVRAGCGPSEVLIPDLERLTTRLAGRVTIGLIGKGSVTRYKASHHGPLRDAMAHDSALVDELVQLQEIFAAYRLSATPSAVVVSPLGSIVTATVDGRPAIESLLHLTLARQGSPAAVSETQNGDGQPSRLEV